MTVRTAEQQAELKTKFNAAVKKLGKAMIVPTTLLAGVPAAFAFLNMPETAHGLARFAASGGVGLATFASFALGAAVAYYPLGYALALITPQPLKSLIVSSSLQNMDFRRGDIEAQMGMAVLKTTGKAAAILCAWPSAYFGYHLAEKLAHRLVG